MKAWHFLRKDRCLGYGDNREVIAGETYTVDGPSELCVRGLHGSKRPLDALKYAPGPVVCRVEIGGDVVEGDDKMAGTTREVLWMYDATEVLREFVRFCALDVVPYWDPPDVVLAWLQTGDESLCNDAYSAAYAAADAAYYAARAAYAAADAAYAAADAAYYAARAAYYAARAAYRGADAARAAYRAARAAYAAARAAYCTAHAAYYTPRAADMAYCATDVAQNTRLSKMLMEGRPK